MSLNDKAREVARRLFPLPRGRQPAGGTPQAALQDAFVRGVEWHNDQTMWAALALASPPPGWYPFGTHGGPRKKVPPLEFWGRDESGLPIWERPKK